MTNQEKLQLGLAIKAHNDDYISWLILSAGSLVCAVLAQLSETIPLLLMTLALFISLFCFYRVKSSLNKLWSCQKELKRHAKDGKTFDEAYELLFEEKESNAK